MPATESALAVAVAPGRKERLAGQAQTGLTATRDKLGLKVLFAGKLDEDTLEQLEAQLLMADCGMAATQHLLDDLRKRWKLAGGQAIRAPCWWMP
jgi:fused signal recognition particle receptor